MYILRFIAGSRMNESRLFDNSTAAFAWADEIGENPRDYSVYNVDGPPIPYPNLYVLRWIFSDGRSQDNPPETMNEVDAHIDNWRESIFLDKARIYLVFKHNNGNLYMVKAGTNSLPVSTSG